MVKSVFACMAFLIFIAGNAFAHKVNIFAYTEDGVVYTESYFSEGKKVVNSKIEVFDSKDNRLLLTGETDEDGKFSFNIPKPTGLLIVLSASMGHKNEYLLTEDEVREALGMAKNPAEISKRTESGTDTGEPAPAAIGIGREELEAVIERIIEKRTALIMKKLVRIEERMGKPSIQDILGGIGYILGLMGIGIYFKYKSRR